MKDRHIHIAEHNTLLKTIRSCVENELPDNARVFKRKMTRKFLFYFLLCLLFYTFLYTSTHPLLFIAGFIFYGFSALLLAFNFAHDFSHGAVFKKRKWNDYGFIFIYALNGAHAEAWKYRHIHSHHYAPNVEKYDSDLNISKLIRVIPGSNRRWFHRFQHLYAPLLYTTYSLYWIFIKDFVLLFSKNDSPGKNFRYYLSFILQKLFYFSYLLVLPLLFSKQGWQVVLTGFVFMHLAQSLFLLFTFFMTHHVEDLEYPETDKEGLIQTSWLMNQVKSSNDMYPFSKTANFIFGGFNNHIAHHLFPHVPHVFYPELSKIIYRVLEENNVSPNKTTYWSGMASHLRHLKKLGKSEH